MKALLVISANNTSSKHHISEHINEQAISIYFPSLLTVFFEKISEFERPNDRKESDQFGFFGTHYNIFVFSFFGVFFFLKLNWPSAFLTCAHLRRTISELSLKHLIAHISTSR